MSGKEPDNKKASPAKQALREKHFLWGKMSFAGVEAYNLLRSNLLLSFPDEETGARVIGVTSVEHAEGKSMTSINMAASLAKANHKTLLLECDLRLPVIGNYLDLDSTFGISDFLTGQAPFQEILHRGVEYTTLDVILCGQIPPNPSELLGSKRMGDVIRVLREKFEYIILDLPPVGTVSDPVSILRHMDGVVFVIRNNLTTKPELGNAIQLVRRSNTRILGFVYNDSERSGHGYSKRYYKKYYSSSG